MMNWKDHCSRVGSGLDPDRNDKGWGVEKKDRISQPRCQPAGVGWTDSPGLASGSAAGAESLEPGRPSPVVPPHLPSPPSRLRAGRGPGEPKHITSRTETRVKHVIEMVACGGRGDWDNRKRHPDKNKNTHITRKSPD